jgi:NAD(P)-dependent dehydrogenase (short-subunit alcohol dehydrogenase family)
MLLKDKVAVITGSSQGIGKGIAMRFVREGASVVINSRTPENVRKTAEEIRALGGIALEAPADVGVEAEAESIFERTMETFGRVDILVNNAVSYYSDRNRLPFLQLHSEDWNEFMLSNLGALFYCTQRAARIMARQGIRGSIINISSNGALRPHRLFIGYDSMKGAMDSFTKAVAVDLGPWGIRVNAIRPGRILIERSPQYNQPRPVRDPNVPLQRTGYAEDVAWAALFLASDEASFVTGQAFEVDGGLLTQGRSPCAEFKPVVTPETIGDF